MSDDDTITVELDRRLVERAMQALDAANEREAVREALWDVIDRDTLRLSGQPVLRTRVRGTDDDPFED